METLRLSFNIVAPMCLILLAGNLLKRSGKIQPAGFSAMNTLCFWLLYPSNLFKNIYSAEDLSAIRPQLIIWVLFLHALMLVLLFLIVPRIIQDNRARASIIQACFRANYISFGLVISSALMSEEDQIVVSVLAGIMIPLYNLGGIAILTYYNGSEMHIKEILKKLITNPFVISCALALFFVITGIRLPDFISSSINSIAAAAVPVSFLALGGFMNINSVKRQKKEIVLGVSLRLLIMPAILIGLSVLAGFRGIELLAIVCTVITPTAVATYNMASMMGADGELAGNLVVFQTLCSLLTMMFWISLLLSLKLF